MPSWEWILAFLITYYAGSLLHVAALKFCYGRNAFNIEQTGFTAETRVVSVILWPLGMPLLLMLHGHRFVFRVTPAYEDLVRKVEEKREERREQRRKLSGPPSDTLEEAFFTSTPLLDGCKPNAP